MHTQKSIYVHRSIIRIDEINAKIWYHFNLPDHSILDRSGLGKEPLDLRSDTVHLSCEKMWVKSFRTIPSNVSTSMNGMTNNLCFSTLNSPMALTPLLLFLMSPLPTPNLLPLISSYQLFSFISPSTHPNSYPYPSL